MVSGVGVSNAELAATELAYHAVSFGRHFWRARSGRDEDVHGKRLPKLFANTGRAVDLARLRVVAHFLYDF